MLGNINIKLPESTPKSLLWAALGIAATLALITLSPELREYIASFVRLTSVQRESAAPPQGCVFIRIATPFASPEARLIFWRHSLDDMQSCNPRGLRQTGKSNVIDIATSSLSEKGSRVAVSLQGGLAVVAVKDRNDGGYVAAVRCDKLALYESEWGTFVPESIQLTKSTKALDESQRNRLVQRCEANDF